MSGIRKLFKPRATTRTTSPRREQQGFTIAAPSTPTPDGVVVRAVTTQVQHTQSEYVAASKHQTATVGDYALVSTSIVLRTLKDVGGFVPGLAAVAGIGMLVLGRFEAMKQNDGTFKSILNQINGLVICLDQEARNLEESGETIPPHFQEQTGLFRRHLELLQGLVTKYQDEKSLKLFLLSDEVKGQLDGIRASIGEMLDHFQIRDSFSNQRLLASWLKERGHVREELADIKESLAVLNTTTSTKEVDTYAPFSYCTLKAEEDIVITSHSYRQGPTNYNKGGDHAYRGMKARGQRINLTHESYKGSQSVTAPEASTKWRLGSSHPSNHLSMPVLYFPPRPLV